MKNYMNFFKYLLLSLWNTFPKFLFFWGVPKHAVWAWYKTFADAIREMRKYSDENIATDGHSHGAHLDTQMQMHMRLFRAQRNFYISGFALFLCLYVGYPFPFDHFFHLLFIYFPPFFSITASSAGLWVLSPLPRPWKPRRKLLWTKRSLPPGPQRHSWIPGMQTLGTRKWLRSWRPSSRRKMMVHKNNVFMRVHDLIIRNLFQI